MSKTPFDEHFSVKCELRIPIQEFIETVAATYFADKPNCSIQFKIEEQDLDGDLYASCSPNNVVTEVIVRWEKS